jgi:ABC-2 type transport system permease protein
MVFLCGLFLPIEQLPVVLRPVAYVLPLTYGVDILHGAVTGHNTMPFPLDFLALGLSCAGLFVISLRNIRRRWIY